MQFKLKSSYKNYYCKFKYLPMIRDPDRTEIYFRTENYFGSLFFSEPKSKPYPNFV